MRTRPLNQVLAKALIGFLVFAGSQFANAFGTICTECIMPPTHIDKLRKEIIYLKDATVRPSAELKKHTATIQMYRGSEFIGTCSAPIIHKFLIATAHHCLEVEVEDSKGNLIEVKKADKFVIEFETDDGTRVSRTSDLAMSEKYPGYDRLKRTGDLGIIWIGDGVPDGFGRVPISKEPLRVGQTFEFAGFGQGRDGAVGKFNSTPGEFLGYSEHGLLMATGTKGSSACAGDSGGPGFVRGENNEILLAGIVSHGKLNGCGAKGDVTHFTELSNYRSWIETAAARLQRVAKSRQSPVDSRK